MFDDRLEVESPGKLPGLVRLDNMRHIHFSRNPLIARVMTEMKYMRDFGEGVDRMYREMEARGMQTPTYEEYAFMLRVTLRNNSEQRQARQIEDPQYDERLLGINERQKTALEYLKHHGRITLREYLELNPAAPERTAQRDLKVLSDLKLIAPTGGRKMRAYILMPTAAT